MLTKLKAELWGLLTSKGLALSLIAGLTLISAGAMCLDFDKLINTQELLATPWAKGLGLKHIFTTWWFLTVVGCFFLNTLACTVKQWQLVRRQRDVRGRQLGQLIKPMLVLPLSEEFLGRTVSSPDIQPVLGKFRYSAEVYQEPEGSVIIACKNPMGRWGSIIFHTGLLVIIAGAFWGQLYKLDAQFFILEGQEFTDRHSEYIQVQEGPLFRENHGQFKVFLHSIKIIGYNQYGVPDNLESELTLTGIAGRGKRVKLTSREPINFAGYQFYQFKHGYVPILGFRAKGSPKGYRITAILDSKHDEQNEEHFGLVQLPDTQLTARVKFFNHLGGNLQNPRAAADQWKNPGLQVQIYDGKSLVDEGVLKPQEKRIFKGNTLEFLELTQWSGLSVTRDQGRIPVYLGFAAVIAGIFLIYFLPPKTVVITLGKDGLSIGGRAERFPALFREELESIRDELKAVLC